MLKYFLQKFPFNLGVDFFLKQNILFLPSCQFLKGTNIYMKKIYLFPPNCFRLLYFKKKKPNIYFLKKKPNIYFLPSSQLLPANHHNSPQQVQFSFLSPQIAILSKTFVISKKNRLKSIFKALFQFWWLGVFVISMMFVCPCLFQHPCAYPAW